MRMKAYQPKVPQQEALDFQKFIFLALAHHILQHAQHILSTLCIWPQYKLQWDMMTVYMSLNGLDEFDVTCLYSHLERCESMA